MHNKKTTHRHKYKKHNIDIHFECLCFWLGGGTFWGGHHLGGGASWGWHISWEVVAHQCGVAHHVGGTSLRVDLVIMWLMAGEGVASMGGEASKTKGLIARKTIGAPILLFAQVKSKNGSSKALGLGSPSPLETSL